MAYRVQRKRKFTRKAPAYVPRQFAIGPLGPQGQFLGRYIPKKKQRMDRGEGNHYFDTERTSTAITANTASWTATEYDPNTSAMLCLFAPVTGDDIFNRQGRKIFVKKIRIMGQLFVPTQTAQTVTDNPVLCRIIVYQDKQTNIAQSQGEDLISSGAGSDAIHMFQNVANLGRFRVWYDKFHVLENPNMVNVGATPATFEQNGLIRNFKITIKPNVEVNYNATNGGTVADVVDNSFHLIANIGTSGLSPTLTYKVRTVFEP